MNSEYMRCCMSEFLMMLPLCVTQGLEKVHYECRYKCTISVKCSDLSEKVFYMNK